MQFVCATIALLLVSNLWAEEEIFKPWKDRHAEGWAWYHNHKQPIESKEIKSHCDPKILIEVAREDLDRALAKSILEPTEENILIYISMQKKWLDQSKKFSDSWKKVILEHPELVGIIPTTQYGVQVKKSIDNENRKKLIQKLAKSHILLFFYEGNNPFSQAFSKVVKQFSFEYDWDVRSISTDGLILRDFPDSIANTDIAEEMEINIFPALFVVEQETRKAIPVAFGMESISQIEENIEIQFQESLK